MSESKLVPNIRFKGFEEEWKKKKIKELGKNYTGGGTPSKKKREFWQGNIPWIQSSDLIQDKVFKLNIRKHITKEAVNESAAKIISRNSIAVVTRVGVGKLVLVPFCYSTSQDFISISDIYDDEKFITYLLFYTLNYSQKASAQQGTSIKGITKKYFLSTQILLPNMIIEQQKIGTFFAKLDRLLDLQQQKLDQLELLKKALLQKLFPKQGTKIPELRFKGFDDEWKTLKFLNFVEKNSLKNKDLSNTNVESISNKTGFTKQSEQFDGYRVASSDLSNYYIIKEKQFAYNPSRINVGSIAYKKIGEKESVVSPLYVSFSTKSNINNQFLWFWFKTQLFTKQRVKLSEGGVRDTLPFEHLKQMHIKAPKISEQQKIGNLFAKVDRLIELENKKFDNLKKVKKSLLQNMFVE